MEAVKSIGLAEGMYIVFLIFIILVFPVILSFFLARKKNRPAFGWVALTLIFSWPIVLAMLLFVKGTDASEPGNSVTVNSTDII